MGGESEDYSYVKRIIVCVQYCNVGFVLNDSDEKSVSK